MNTSSTPTVSICIPTYKGEKHIGAAIESVLTQSFTDFELIIIDDNSPDQTHKVVNQFQDKRLLYIKNDANFGPEGNWNKCLAVAQGKYFKLLPHDDILAPDCLRNQINVLENDLSQSIALVFSSRNIIDSSQKIITSRGYPLRREGVIPSHAAIKHCIRSGTNLIGEPGAVMFRKSLSEKTGVFDGSISYPIDLDYWFRLLLNGDAYYIDKQLASFRVAPGSWSIDIGSRQSDDFIRFINRCSNNPSYQITLVDRILGNLMARINNFLRLLFYKFI